MLIVKKEVAFFRSKVIKMFGHYMPRSNIQNPGSSKQEEVTSRGVRKLSALKKTESQTWGGNAVKKNRVPTFRGLCFFPEPEKNRVHK